MGLKTLLKKLKYNDRGFSQYVAFMFVLPILLTVVVGGSYVGQSIRVMGTLDHSLKIIGDNMTQNGALTAPGQEQLRAYIEKSGLDVSKIYLNATTTPQSYGSRGLQATIGYDFDLKAPGSSGVIWHKYYEKSLPIAQSQLIPGSGADTSGSVPINSVFAGVQGGTASGGDTSSSGTGIQATSMTMTCNNPSPVANASVAVSGKVYVGSNAAPAGTQVSLNGGGVRQFVSTDSSGNFTANIAFTTQGTVTLQGTSGTASASVAINVQPSVPATITLQVPTTIQIGNSFNIIGKVVDASGGIVADNTPVTISSSNATDIPPTNVNTSFGSFTYTVNKITTLDSFTITVTAGSATTTKTVDVIPGNPQSLTLNASPATVSAGSTVTFSGKVLGPYGTPPAENTPVKIISGTNVVDDMPSGVTDDQGNFSMTATLTKAGSHVFYAQTTGSINSPTVTVNVTSSVPYKVNNLSQTPNPLNAGANLAISGSVIDQYDNPISSGTTLLITSSALSEDVSTVVQAGKINGHVTMQTPGIQTLTIANSSGDPLAGGSFTVTVLATSAFTLLPDQDTYTMSAGQSIGSVQFTLKDSNGNPVAGKTVKFTETPQGDSLITPLTAVTDASGRVQTTVGTLTKAGTHTLMATLGDDPDVIGTAGITVNPGAPTIILSNVAPSTTQVYTDAKPVPLPLVSGTITDSYANPITGANLTISGGFGATVSGITGDTGYYAISIKPTNVGGPFPLTFNITSPYGNLTAPKGNITVTATPVVPTQSVLEGVSILDQTGTMPNMATRNPNGMGAGRSQALTFWTGGGSGVFLKPQKGYYDGIDTWTYYSETNLAPSNIKSGVSILGVTGTYGGGSASHGSLSWTTPGTYYWTVPDGISTVMVRMTGGGGGGGGGQPVNNYNGGYTYGGGGGGGSDSYVGMVSVTPGQVVTIVVGAGGNAGTNGNYNYPWNPFGNSPPYGYPATAGQDGGHSSFAGAIVYGGRGGGAAYHAFGDFYNTKVSGTGGSPGAYGGGAFDIQLGLSLTTKGTAGEFGSFGGGYSVPSNGGNKGQSNGGYGGYDSYRDYSYRTNASKGGNGSVYIQW